MRTESKQVQRPQYCNTVPADSAQRSGKTNGTTVPIGQNNKKTNTDSFNKTDNSLTQAQQQRYDEIYKRIENLCKDQDIDIKLAKDFGLLEKIAGVMTKAELVQLQDNTINALIAILSNSLGWGDGLGFGDKDRDDLTKLVKDIHEKIALEKTGGSKWGQAWHNVKKGVKSIFGGKNVENCQNENEVSTYYQKKYLNNIKNATPEEKIKTYQELLREFYYDFNAQKSTEKQLQMIKAIENLAAEDRAVMVKVIENSFIQDPSALALFGKILDINFESIVLNRDGFNNTVSKNDATGMSHTAYRHMSEDDICESLNRNRERAKGFMVQHSATAGAIRDKQSKGIKLSPEEQDILARMDCINSRYAGALTGISSNNTLSESVKCNYLSKVSNDTTEMGIQEEVLETVVNFIKANPEAVLMPKEKFIALMDKVTNGKYSVVLKRLSKNSNNNKIIKTITQKTKEESKTQKSKENKEKVVNEKESKYNNTNIKNKDKIDTKNPKYNTSDGKIISNPIQQDSTTTLANSLIFNDTDLSLSMGTTNKSKSVTYKKLEFAAQKGVEAVNKVIEESNLNEFEATVHLLSMSNLEANVEKLAFDTFEKWNDSQKALYCNYIENNSNKIKAGKMIKSTSALKNVKCNNFYVKSEFEDLIKEKEEDKNSNSNIHLSTQKSFC